MTQIHPEISAGDLRRIISQKPDRGVLEFNSKGVVGFASPEFLNLTGQKQKDIIGRPLHSLIPEEDFQSNIEKLLQRKVPLARFVSPWDDGNHDPIFLSFKCYPPFQDSQKIISAVKKASGSLHQSDNVPPQVYIDYALQQMPGALWHYSLKAQQFEYLSPAIEKIFGTSIEAFLKNPLFDVHPEDQVIFRNFFGTLDGSSYVEFRYKQRNGGWQLIGGYRYVVTNKEGHPTSIAGIFLNQAQSVSQGYQLESALKTIEQLTQERLMNSVKTIQAHHEILARHCQNTIDRDRYEILESLGIAINRMSGLMNGLSQSLHIINQQSPRQTVDLEKLLKDTIIPCYSQNDLRIEIGDLPKVYADRKDLTILFKNIIHNGIRHNHNTPKIAVKGKSSQNCIIIAIQDNGIGIPKEAYHQIFEPGRRLDMALPSENGGMGLALCKMIVEKYGGHMRIRSKVKLGTTIFIVFPKG